MNRIYFDNAATTAVDPEVLKAMLPFFSEEFGNASSIYSFGRTTRMAVENSRKLIAGFLNVKPGEIFFTSCGTESTNTAIECAIRDLGCKHIISSPIEHHATLHKVDFMKSLGVVEVSYVKLTQDGHIDLVDFENLLANQTQKTLVTLMHANNEIGNITDVKYIGELCQKHNAIFHTDMVQTLAHFPINLSDLHIHFISGSAHKFHGPKGSGLLYINNSIQVKPYIHGGAQERNMRAGTENTAGIIGFAKAMELALLHHEEDMTYINSLKQYMKDQLSSNFNDLIFHGDTSDKSLYTVLNVGFPINERTEMLSINLDIAGICVSGGSACSSGAQGGSHVIKSVYPHENRVPIRFSFSKHNTFEEIDSVVKKILELI